MLFLLGERWKDSTTLQMERGIQNRAPKGCAALLIARTAGTDDEFYLSASLIAVIRYNMNFALFSAVGESVNFFHSA